MENIKLPKKTINKPNNTDINLALVTVTSESFVPGTLVMLFSFLEQHPTFQGDIIVIHDNLALKYRKQLESLTKIIFRQVSDELKSHIQRLVTYYPKLATRQARFFSLETLLVQNYDKVLFCDSDLLFQQSVDDLFILNKPLICCGDGPYYQNNVRDEESFSILPKNTSDKKTLSNTFNSGFILIDKSLITDQNYQGLLALLNEKTWKNNTLSHTDQVIFNRYFSGQQHLMPCTYNYLLRYRTMLHKLDQSSFKAAKVLHFNHHKPWQANRMLEAVVNDAGLLPAFRLWNEAYFACIKYLAMKNLNHKLMQ